MEEEPERGSRSRLGFRRDVQKEASDAVDNSMPYSYHLPAKSSPLTPPGIALRPIQPSAHFIRMPPKGCFCQIGSLFRVAIFLVLILGITAGVIYWIYQSQFVKTDDVQTHDNTHSDHDAVPRKSKAILEMEVKFMQKNSSSSPPELPDYPTTNEEVTHPKKLMNSATFNPHSKDSTTSAPTTTTSTTTTATTLAETTTTTTTTTPTATPGTADTTTATSTTTTTLAAAEMGLTTELDFDLDLSVIPAISLEPKNEIKRAIIRMDDRSFGSGESTTTEPDHLTDRPEDKNGITENKAEEEEEEEDGGAGGEELDEDDIDETEKRDTQAAGTGAEDQLGASSVQDPELSTVSTLLKDSMIPSIRTDPPEESGTEAAPVAQHDELVQGSSSLEQPEDDRPPSDDGDLDDAVVVIYGSQAAASEGSRVPSIKTFTIGPVNQAAQLPSGDTDSDEDDGLLISMLSSAQFDPAQYHLTPSFMFATTKTVTGFLDFVTTVGNTVLIFTPFTTSDATGKHRVPATSLAPAATPSLSLDDEPRPTFGIEELFKDFEKPSSQAQFDQSLISPSAVLKRQPEALIDLESTAEENPDSGTVTSTLYSNFVNGETKLLGLVTSTAGTLVANGITTVRAVEVIGTLLPSGKYAHIVETKAEVFKHGNDDTGFAGSVQHVDEKPAIGLEVADQAAAQSKSSPNKIHLSDFFRNDQDKSKASKDLRDRLKNRYQKFRESNHDLGSSGSSISGSTAGATGSVLQISPSIQTTASRRSRQMQRGSSHHSRTSSEVAHESEETGRSSAATVSERALRLDTRKSFSASSPRLRSRNRQTTSAAVASSKEAVTKNEDDYTTLAIIQHEAAASKEEGFGSRFNRFRNSQGSSSNRKRFSPRKPDTTASSLSLSLAAASTSAAHTPVVHGLKIGRPEVVHPVAAAPSSDDSNGRRPAGVALKSFNRFNRPDIRKSLLEKILHKGKGGEHHADSKEKSDQQESSAEATFAPETGDSNESNDPDAKLMSTLSVSTVDAAEAGRSDAVLEVATIRSPYSFAYEDSSSTRFITVTRTLTKSIITPTSTTAAPLFQTETIPAPVNILASTVPASLPETTDLTDLSSSIETLPAIILASSAVEEATPALKTVTETFSTKELSLKTSILPIIINGKTSLHTVTESYYVTKMIEAVKTLPSIDNFEFVATKAFKDFSNVLDEAGSEKREQLLPGELEFSDQDTFDLTGPSVVRVPPPEGFENDLKLEGNKVEESKETSTSSAQQTPIQSSFLPSSTGVLGLPDIKQTPALPENLLNPLAGLSQEQIRQLALLQYLQNLGGFGGLGGFNAQVPQVITSSKPIYTTETVYATSTIPLFLGAKKFYTTLTQSIGMTTLTGYETHTVAASALPQPAVFPLLNPAAAQLPLGPTSLPDAFTVTSHAVTQDTVLPSTIEKEIRITFRNSPTVTTLTSTTMVSTQITSYVTQTVRNLATLNPLAGLTGFNPLAALLG